MLFFANYIVGKHSILDAAVLMALTVDALRRDKSREMCNFNHIEYIAHS